MTTPLVQTKTYTIEEYEALPDDGNIYELLEGNLIMAPPPGGSHGRTEAGMAIFLGAFVVSNNLGRIWTNTRFVIERKKTADGQGRDTELAPDVAFIANPDVPPDSPGAVPIPPHLAVEVQSPGDTLPEVEIKVRKYLEVGVKLVWLVRPAQREVLVYRPQAPEPQTLKSEQELDGENVVPGFKLRVGQLFEL